MADRESLWNALDEAIRHHEFAVLATLNAQGDAYTAAEERLAESRGRIIEVAQELYEQGGGDFLDAINRG